MDLIDKKEAIAAIKRAEEATVFDYSDSAHYVHVSIEVIQTLLTDAVARGRQQAAASQAKAEPVSLSNAASGTRAPAVGGGAWVKSSRGWRWGDAGPAFNRPGGDWTGRLLEPNPDSQAPAKQVSDRCADQHLKYMGSDLPDYWLSLLEEAEGQLRSAGCDVTANRIRDSLARRIQQKVGG